MSTHRHARSASRPAPFRTPASTPSPMVAGHRPLGLALALAAAFAMAPAGAQPSGAQAIHGGATLTQQGNTLLVTTTNGAGTQHSAINWQSFSVPGGTTTWFAQPSAASTSINRVVGPDPSLIYGTLGSNGRLVLVNPAGIAVGAGAVVDTAGFTASTLRMSDADALAGRLRFGDGPVGALLKVDGQVLAREGDVVLIGRQVEVGAQAVVRSPEGATILAAGQQAQVTGRGLEGIVFTLQAPEDRAVNLGTLAGDAVGVFAGTLRHSGLVRAQAVTAEGGRVVLRAADTALVDGRVRAQGAAGAGGSVDVLGAKVGLLAGAEVDTSNTQGGGRIRVGGDYQGANAALPNAQVVFMDRAATLRADATQQGDGGRVIVWSDDTTRAHGTISARGGAQGGDGGFVETSGKRHLDVNGVRVDASAVAGRAGTWLLDPDDLTIAAGPTPTAPPESTTTDANGAFVPVDSYLPSVVYDSTLNAALDSGLGTNVVVKTGSVSTVSYGSGSGDILVQGGVRLARSLPGTATLTLDAWRDIRFQAGATTAIQGSPLDGGDLIVSLKAGGGGTGGGVFVDSGATVQAGGGGGRVDMQMQRGSWFTNGGSLTLLAGASLTVPTTFDNQGRLELAGGALDVGTLRQVTATPDPTGSPLPTPAPTISAYDAAKLKVRNSFEVTGSFMVQGSAELDVTQASGDLVIDGAATIITAGAVSLAAPGGSVRLLNDPNNPYAYLAAGALTITAGGDIDTTGKTVYSHWSTSGPITLAAGGQALFSTINSEGGDVTITATQGISGGTIAANLGEGSGGENGGNINLTSSAGGIAVSSLRSWGTGNWSGTGTGKGGDAGTITVDAATTIEIDTIDGYGGTGHSPSGVQVAGTGGRGAAINLTSRSTSGSIYLGYVDASGGTGGTGVGVGGTGGQGGTVTIRGAGATSVSLGWIDALGGNGGDGGYVPSPAPTVAPTTFRGGQGGLGGSVDIANLDGSGLAMSMWGGIDVSGGGGGGTLRDGATGGAGGQGGSIVLRAAGPSAITGLYAGGGYGGSLGWSGTRSYFGTAGAGTAGGSIDIIATSGAVDVSGSIDTSGGFGGYNGTQYGAQAGDGFVRTSGAGTVNFVPYVGEGTSYTVYIAGNWTNAGTATIADGVSLLVASPSVYNTGTVDLGNGRALEIGREDSTGNWVRGTFTNAPTGTLRGTGWIDGDVLNQGTVAPGTDATIGRIEVYGNLDLASTSQLQMKVAPGSPPQPGVTHDQLLVGGAVTLGGSLVVREVAVTAPAQTTAPTPAPTIPPRVSFAALPPASTQLALIDAQGGATGSFASVTASAGVLSQIVINTSTGPVVVPYGTWIDPNALPQADTPLVDSIVELLNGGAPVNLIQQALSEQDSVVTQFLSLLVKESQKQDADGKKEPAIVQTGTACVPGS